MNTNRDPKEIAESILERSICSVQVGACLADKHGIISWGWNAVGLGYGLHAEHHALLRANRDRLAGSTLYVASRRMRTGKPVTARPCPRCEGMIVWAEIGKIFWRAGNGLWYPL